MENNLNNKQGWALRDVIMMALLGLVFAAVYLAVFNLGMALAAALTTTGLGDFAFDIIYGVWFMAGTLGAYIIRKKGAGLISELLASVMELLYGNAGGITVVITGFIQGLGTELGFACFKWKKWGFLSLSVAGVLSGIFIYIYELFYLQYYMLDPMMHVGHLVIRSISAIHALLSFSFTATDPTAAQSQYGFGISPAFSRNRFLLFSSSFSRYVSKGISFQSALTPSARMETASPASFMPSMQRYGQRTKLLKSVTPSSAIPQASDPFL